LEAELLGGFAKQTEEVYRICKANRRSLQDLQSKPKKFTGFAKQTEVVPRICKANRSSLVTATTLTTKIKKLKK
jgi:hypothetical protein